MPDLQIDYVMLLTKLVSSVVVLLIALVLNSMLRRVLRRRISDTAHMRTVYTLGRNLVLLVVVMIVLMIWLGPSSNISVAMGILGAGIAFASQETIGSFAGYLSIVLSGIYRIGDRVCIGDVTGDVLDIGILRTTVMEIGQWVRAEQYTGRVVTIANRAIFSDPVFNYTQHWPYIWDEITLPVTYESDWRRAAEIVLRHGQEYSEEFQANAEATLEQVRRRFPIQTTSVAPSLYVVMTDNWIELTMRYVVEVRKRRGVMAELHRELLEHFEREPSISIASATFEIVGFPPLRQASSVET